MKETLTESFNKLERTNNKKGITRIKLTRDTNINAWTSVKGGNRYFVYIQERYMDLFVYIHKGVITFVNEKEHFEKSDLKFVAKKEKELLEGLLKLKEKYNKKLTFSNMSSIPTFVKENLN